MFDVEWNDEADDSAIGDKEYSSRDCCEDI